MRKFNWLVGALFFAGTFNSFAQAPRVPSSIHFADMELRLNEQARKEIQLDVDALYRGEKYFNIKLNRVAQYFPIIERVLKEENVPDDFKYLVIQESALIPDAISTSNAVGFWQFKEPSAREVGLRVDRFIDERMNIISSTHGAARYLKKLNFYFNNWLYALLAYNTGPAGAENHVNDRHFGDKKMEITRNTHWYVKKYLAHKIAFESALKNYRGNATKLFEYTDGTGKSLSEIAREFNVDNTLMLEYNKWLRHGDVPHDKIYTVLIPGTDLPQEMIARKSTNSGQIGIGQKIKNKNYSPRSNNYPIVKQMDAGETRIVRINGIPGIVAKSGDNLKNMATVGQVSLERFLKCNEIDISHHVIPGMVYYFRHKKNMAKEHYHTVQPGEDPWAISQKYGIKKKKLLRKNRFRKDNVDLKSGLVLWLRHIRPADQPVQYGIITGDAVAGVPEQESRKASSNIQPDKSGQVDDEVSPSLSSSGSINSDNMLSENNVIGSDTMITTGNNQQNKDDHNENYQDLENTDDPITRSNNDGQVDGKSTREIDDHDMKQRPLFHIVRAGETIYGISRQYDVPVEVLLAINDLSVDAKIGIGEKIYLKDPFAKKIPDLTNTTEKEVQTYTTYKVKKGDTMYSISRKFQVSVEDILLWNGKKNYELQEGEEIKIKTTR